MAITQQADYVAEYKLPIDNFSKLDNYIEKYEKLYLNKLLGAELYALFIADLTPVTPQVPNTAIYLSLFNPFIIDKDGCLLAYEGMKTMLIQFIYFHFNRNMVAQASQTGNVTNKNSNSTSSRFKGYNLIDSYNEGVDNFLVAQWFVHDNLTDYPKENTQVLTHISGI